MKRKGMPIMSKPFNWLRSMLSHPVIYVFFSEMVGMQIARSFCIQNYACPKSKDKILDIGCGTGDMLDCLPEDIEYIGFDLNQRYIDFAIKKYGKRGKFFCKKISKESIKDLEEFDIVIASCVIHHLPDAEAIELFELAKKVLKASGRLITIDGCYVKGQSPIDRYLLSKDRGKYVRTEEGYRNLAASIFSNIKVHIHKNLVRIPNTLIIMECS